jgi:hypothetical protein
MAVRLSALRAGRPLPPGRFLVLISVRGWVDPRAIVRLEGLGHLKTPMTLSTIEPATFQLIAFFLNQLRYRVPLFHALVNLSEDLLRLYTLGLTGFQAVLQLLRQNQPVRCGNKIISAPVESWILVSRLPVRRVDTTLYYTIIHGNWKAKRWELYSYAGHSVANAHVQSVAGSKYWNNSNE